MSQNDLNKEKALVVFSGGQDSTTCLFYAKNILKKLNSLHLIMDNDMIQKLKLQKIAKEQNLKHHILDMSLLSQLTPNALTQHELKIEDNDDGIPNTFVPARNLLFLSLLARWPIKFMLNILLLVFVKQIFRLSRL